MWNPTRPLTGRLAAICLAAMCAASVAAASNEPPRVTRADLGWTLLELEQAMDARDLDDRTIWWVNRNFDAAVSYFFTNRHREAVELINSITLELLPEDERSPMIEWLMSVTAEIEPRAFAAGEPNGAQVIIRSLQASPAFPFDEAKIELRLLDAEGTVARRMSIDLTDSLGESFIRERIELAGKLDDLPEGAYQIELARPDGDAMRYRHVFVLPDQVDALRRGLLQRIDAVDDESGELARAIRIARTRAALLKERPSPLNSAEFLADMYALHGALQREVAAMERGDDPYVMREGDLWRPVATRRTSWPMRVYAPDDLDGDEPLPLVIGLHGAGGDENMFHNSYGNGIIRRLADANRFIVASPVTYPLGGDMTLLGELIEELQRCYPIDKNRVYLIGHSLGGGTVSAALLAMPERFAAVACIAGAGRFAREDESKHFPPVLAIGAEHDFVVSPESVRQQAEAGIERGLPIEYRLARHWGHVLVVGGVLEEVVDWLLTHERIDPQRSSDAE